MSGEKAGSVELLEVWDRVRGLDDATLTLAERRENELLRGELEIEEEIHRHPETDEALFQTSH